MVNDNITNNIQVKIPENMGENTGKALVNVSEGIKSLFSVPEHLVKIVENRGATLFAPIKAYLEGKAKTIQAHSSFIEAQQYRQEESLKKLAYSVIGELNEKANNNEYIPESIQDSDVLFSIQNTVSEISDAEFIKFWGKLYTEEACKPNSISKKTVELCKSLNKETALLLQQDIFPYCTIDGIFWGAEDVLYEKILKAMDYGFLNRQSRVITITQTKKLMCLPAGKAKFIIHPAYAVTAGYGSFGLTSSAIEIIKCLKIYPDEQQILIIAKNMKQASLHWDINKDIKEKFRLDTKNAPKFILCDENNNIIFPEDWQNRTVDEYADLVEEEIVFL